MKPTKFLALDIGEKRIGVAAADSATKLAYPLLTVDVDGMEFTTLRDLIQKEQATALVVGYPRNSEGLPTQQTAYVEGVARQLQAFGLPISFQDESLTSVAAEAHLKSSGHAYGKKDIDAHAAAIILTDYIEAHYA